MSQGDGGEALGLAPRSGGGGVPKRSCAPGSARAPPRPPEGHAGSAGTLRAGGVLQGRVHGCSPSGWALGRAAYRLGAPAGSRRPHTVPPRVLGPPRSAPRRSRARFPGRGCGLPPSRGPAGPGAAVRRRATHLLPPGPPRDPEVQAPVPAADPRVGIQIFILVPSSVEVSPSRCASGENRTSPSATPQQIAYTSGGETGRGRSRLRGGGGKARSQNSGLTTGKTRRKEKESAPSSRRRPCAAFPKALAPPPGERQLHVAGPKFCAEAGSAGRAPRGGDLALRAGGAGDAAGARGHWGRPGTSEQAAGGGGARGTGSFLFDLGGLPLVIVCGPAWGPLGAPGVPGGAAVISAPSAPPPPRPHRPGAGRCHLLAGGGPRGRTPLLGPGNRCVSPPASAGQPPSGL